MEPSRRTTKTMRRRRAAAATQLRRAGTGRRRRRARGDQLGADSASCEAMPLHQQVLGLRLRRRRYLSRRTEQRGKIGSQDETTNVRWRSTTSAPSELWTKSCRIVKWFRMTMARCARERSASLFGAPDLARSCAPSTRTRYGRWPRGVETIGDLPPRTRRAGVASPEERAALEAEPR